MSTHPYEDMLAEAAAQHAPAAQPKAAVHTTYIPSDTDDVDTLIREVVSRGADIAPGYDEWVELGFAIASEYGEGGRDIFRTLSQLHPGVTDQDIDRQYDKCLNAGRSGITIKTLFHLAKQAGIIIATPKVTKGQVVTMSLSTSVTVTQEEQPEDDTESEPLPTFDEAIYNNLPELLIQATAPMNTTQEKDLVLIGSIVVLSACMQPVFTIYGGKKIWANSYLFVPGPAGSGKGRLDLCWRLAAPIHRDLVEIWNEAKEQYKKDLADYQRNKKNGGVYPPDRPPITLLRVPGNSSATSFNQALSENPSLLQFETEGDTIVNTFKNDYGNYSDSYRKAFAHESFGYLRRGNDGEHAEVIDPKLAVVLSGTPEQLRSLIKDSENVLFSRFLFYNINADDSWRNGFIDDVDGQSLEEHFDNLGQDYHEFYQRLSSSGNIRFYLTLEQQQKFNDFMAECKANFLSVNGRQYSASAHRLAWAHLRISMVLSVLRLMELEEMPKEIYCTDADFETALSLIKTINRHNDYVFNLLSAKSELTLTASDSFRSSVRKAILDALPPNFSSSDFEIIAKTLGSCKRTVRRQVDRAILDGIVRKTGHDSYVKV